MYTGMTLICGHPVIPSYVSTTTLLLPSSPAFTPGTVTPTFTATHALGHTSEFTSVSQSDNPSSSQTIQTSDTVRYDQSSLFSQSVTEGSSNETTNQQNKSPNDQSGNPFNFYCSCIFVLSSELQIHFQQFSSYDLERTLSLYVI